MEMFDPTTSGARQDALGESEAFLAFQQRLSDAAKVDRPVLLIGERGTGKELAARRLHFLSLRWNGPLVTLNCAALAPTLIAAELFGHEAGAFTGARAARPGRFEAADGGTLFLDELGAIPREAQEKILRVVEYGTFERVGGTTPIETDVRIVGATHADLPRLAEEGRFMRDLLDRLSFEVLRLPPLRERGDDILLLANHFAARMRHELGRPGVPRFSDRASDALLNYPWPGNVRELKNVVERAVYRAEDETIDAIRFDPFPQTDRPATPRRDETLAPTPQDPAPVEEEAPSPFAPPIVNPQALPDFKDAVAMYEVNLLRVALQACRHNQRETAARLGLTYHQFRGLYRKYADALA